MHALIVICLHFVTAYPPAIQPEAQEYHAAVVRVFGSDGNGSTGSGTGVLVAKRGNEGLVLTAWHNVENGPPHAIVWPERGESTYRIIAHDADFDVAALHVGVPQGVEPIPLASKLPLSGSTVELAGYSGGRWELTYPKIRGYYSHRFSHATDLGLTTITTNGESGGPVITFNDKREPMVAGIVWGGRTAYSDKSMKFGQATDSVQIKAWLRQAIARKYPWVSE